MPIFSHIFLLLSPVLAGVGLLLGGWWVWLHPFVMYGLISILEVWWKGSCENTNVEIERARAEHWFSRLIVWSIAPILLALLVALMWRVDNCSVWELIGMIIGVGTSVGTLGINGAHELGHNRDAASRRTAEFLLLVSFFMHFHLEHNRGHHARVCTAEDPATARKDQSLYSFWLQTLWGGMFNAWQLERTRLTRQDRSIWSLHNSMLRYALLQAALLGAVALWIGPAAAGVWLLVAIFGILLLETTNYFQHYGLVRQKRESGALERVGPQHSWSGNHPISRVILLNLPRHADHHIFPDRHFSNLRHLPESPLLPLGYSGMVILALIPPLFTQIMNKTLAAQQAPAS